MVKLFEFTPGSLILSAEVNTNFAKLVEIVGSRSTNTQLVLPGQLAFGAREAATVSALTDRAEATSGFIHFGWNAKESFNTDGSVAVRRVITDGSSFMRIGDGGLSFFGSAETGGDLNPEKLRIFSIYQNKSIFIHPDWSFVNVSGGVTSSIDDYRLMLTPLASPVEIVNSGAFTSYNVNKELSLDVGSYHGVQLLIEATRTKTGDAPLLRIYGEGTTARLSTKVAINEIGTTNVQSSAFFDRSAGKTGHKLTISVDGALNALKVYVTGVWK